MSQTLTCFNYHLIFSTKNRAAMITPDLQSRLYEYMGGTIRAKGGKLLAASGTRDHVHLLASLRPLPAIPDILRDIKSNSSKWIHETFERQFALGWQDGYRAFSVSYSNIEQVRGYIESQEQHHHPLSFKEEFIQFLERHGVEYDLRYIWD